MLVAKDPPYCYLVVVGSERMEWKEVAFGKQNQKTVPGGLQGSGMTL